MHPSLPDQEITSPYPRPFRLNPKFAPLWQRMGVDAVALGLGYGLTPLVFRDSGSLAVPLAVVLVSIPLGTLGERRGIAVAWQTATLVCIGAATGLSLLPPKLPDYAGNFADSVFYSGLFVWMASLIVSFILWFARKDLSVEPCDAYQAIRRSIGRLFAFTILFPVTSLAWFVDGLTGALLCAVFVNAFVAQEVLRTAKKACINRAAVLTAALTPVAVSLVSIGLFYRNSHFVPVGAWISLGSLLTIASFLAVFIKPGLASDVG